MPAVNGEPGYAPASKAIHTSAATSVPSFFAPILARRTVPDVGPVASRTLPGGS